MSGDQSDTNEREGLERRAQEVLEGLFISKTFSDGKTYHIPAWVVAVERAIYYAELDSGRGDGTFDEVFENELAIARDDPDYFLDYVSNSTNWEDVSDHAVLFGTEEGKPNYASEWGNDIELWRHSPEDDTWKRKSSY